jgi:hypothetical protein
MGVYSCVIFAKSVIVLFSGPSDFSFFVLTQAEGVFLFLFLESQLRCVSASCFVFPGFVFAVEQGRTALAAVCCCCLCFLFLYIHHDPLLTSLLLLIDASSTRCLCARRSACVLPFFSFSLPRTCLADRPTTYLQKKRSFSIKKNGAAKPRRCSNDKLLS